MVIGGQQHAVGSDVTAVSAAIEAVQRHGADALELRLEHRDGRIRLFLGASDRKGASATVWLVL